MPGLLPLVRKKERHDDGRGLSPHPKTIIRCGLIQGTRKGHAKEKPGRGEGPGLALCIVRTLGGADANSNALSALWFRIQTKAGPVSLGRK